MAWLADIDIAYQSSLKSFWMMCNRHLDNLLLTKDGRLFHIDFGFILGRDPKPFPPPMKLCKEMVEAMGGAERYSLSQDIQSKFLSVTLSAQTVKSSPRA